MTKKNLFAFLTALLGLAAFCGLSFSDGRSDVRVCVVNENADITLAVRGPYEIKALNSDMLLAEGKTFQEARIFPTDTGLRIGDRDFRIYGVRIIPGREASIYVDGSRLRGIIDIIRTENLKILVVNHIDVEEYLYGVLYHEMPHYWPLEALKAQAVAARTFVLYRKSIMSGRDYDVTSDIYSQVYGGHSSERNVARKAVDRTRGQVLKYGGDILPAYYHSICAGHTENAEKVFGINIAPLSGVECPYCADARGINWKDSFSYKQIEEELNKYGINVSGVNYIACGRRDKSGRLENVVIKDKSGTKEIEGYKFRLALGPNRIKSANFETTVTPKGIIFKGRGWGHGVGMCQWGAFGMAKRWANYKKILEFYYPGAEISKF